MKDCKHSCLKHANGVGLFFVALLAICFAWYFIHPVEQDLHMSLLKLSFFGFDGMNAVSFLLGALQAYVWGYIVVGIVCLVKRSCHHHHDGKNKDCCK